MAASTGESEAVLAAARLLDLSDWRLVQRLLNEAAPGTDDVSRVNRIHLTALLVIAIGAPVFALLAPGGTMRGLDESLTWLPTLGVMLALSATLVGFAKLDQVRRTGRIKEVYSESALERRKLRDGAVFALADLRSPASIGPLHPIGVWLAVGISEKAIIAARQAVLETITGLTPEDGLALTSAERKAMRSLLRRSCGLLSETKHNSLSAYEVEVPIALIRAYTLVGDACAAALIRWIANTHHSTYHPEVIKAAQESLSAVLERVEWDRQQRRNFLLRPADAAREVLLRPSTQAVPTEQLLRPAANTSDESDAS